MGLSKSCLIHYNIKQDNALKNVKEVPFHEATESNKKTTCVPIQKLKNSGSMKAPLIRVACGENRAPLTQGYSKCSLPNDRSNSIIEAGCAISGKRSKQSINLIKLKKLSSKQSPKRLFSLPLDEKMHILFFMDNGMQKYSKIERKCCLDCIDSKRKETIRAKTRNSTSDQRKAMVATKDIAEIRLDPLKTFNRGKYREEEINDSTLISGAQLSFTRAYTQSSPSSIALFCSEKREKSFTRNHCVLLAHGIESKMIEKTPVQWNGSDKTNLTSIEVARDLMNAVAKFHSINTNCVSIHGNKNRFLGHATTENMAKKGVTEKTKSISEDDEEILFAMVPWGISSSVFSNVANLNNSIEAGTSIL